MVQPELLLDVDELDGVRHAGVPRSLRRSRLRAGRKLESPNRRRASRNHEPDAEDGRVPAGPEGGDGVVGRVVQRLLERDDDGDDRVQERDTCC